MIKFGLKIALMFKVKKKITLSLLFCLVVIFVKAQFVNYKWSDTFSSKSLNHIEGTFGSANGDVLVVFADNDKNISDITLVIGHINKETIKTIQHHFEQPVNSIIGAITTTKNTIVFTETITGKEDNYVQLIQAHEFDEQKIFKSTTLFTFTSKIKQHLAHQRFIQSPDLSKTLLFIESPCKQGSKEEINILIYDNNAKETLNKTLQIDLDSKFPVYNYPEISNGGALFFLKKDKEKNAYRYFIYSYNEMNNSFAHKQITLANAQITEIKGQVTAQGEYIVGGFFASEPIHEFEGYYLFKFDQNCSQKFKTQSVFDESTFLKFISKKEYTKDPSIKNFYMDNIAVLENGKIFIEAEYYEEQDMKDKSAWVFYKDVMLICFDENGKYKTSYNHQKKQSVSEDFTEWASYKTYGYGDSLGIIHNNMVKTEGLKHPEPYLQFTQANEIKGLKIKPAIHFDKSGESPFFLPKIYLLKSYDTMILGFCDFEKTNFKLVYINLKPDK